MHEIGITAAKSSYGHDILVYDKERTVVTSGIVCKIGMA